jgi:predicted dehydrogenase
VAETDTLSEMEIDIEDTAAVLCRFESGTIGTVYLDYIERPSRHELLIIGTKGSIVWNNTEGGAILHDSDRKEPETFHPPAGFERNTMFLNEMTHFIDCIREDRDPDCGLTDGIRVLEIIKSIKESVHNRRRVDVISRV